MSTICGIDCGGCGMKAVCKGCTATDGHPFGGSCVTAECYKSGGKEFFRAYKAQLIEEFNALGIADMPPITELCPLCGAFVNMAYPLPNGETVKLLDDRAVYLGYQVSKAADSRCYGLAADEHYLLVCEYGENGSNPEIVVYRKRAKEVRARAKNTAEREDG